MNGPLYYMASSVSNKLPKRARWSYLARSGLHPPRPARKIPGKSYIKSFIDQTCSVNVAGYWPRSFFAYLWTSTLFRSITQVYLTNKEA